MLVLIAPTEHKIRIDVGYGLEGVLPNELVDQIIHEDFLAGLRANDYNGGIRSGVTRLVAVLERRYR